MTSTYVATNHSLAQRFFEAQDRLRGGPDASFCSADYQAELGGYPPMPREGHEQFALAFYAGFPDLHHEFLEIISTDEIAVVRFALHGTHTGTLFGIPATQRTVRIVCNVILHITDGLVTRLQGVFDEAGMLRQIGVLPT